MTVKAITTETFLVWHSTMLPGGCVTLQLSSKKKENPEVSVWQKYSFSVFFFCYGVTGWLAWTLAVYIYVCYKIEGPWTLCVRTASVIDTRTIDQNDGMWRHYTSYSIVITWLVFDHSHWHLRRGMPMVNFRIRLNIWGFQKKTYKDLINAVLWSIISTASWRSE